MNAPLQPQNREIQKAQLQATKFGKPYGRLAPVFQVTNPLEHAQALWPGLFDGNPQGIKSIWPVPHHSSAERLVDKMIYVRTKTISQEQQEELDNCKSFLMGLDGQKDKYISLNTFYGSRRHSNLRCLTGFVVDLDLGKTDYGSNFMTLRQDALDAINSARIPCPTMAVHTGRGVHLYWLFDRFVPSRAFPRWRACTNRLIALLKQFGADPAVSDTARVLRLVGTRNSKAICVNPDDGSEHLWRVTAEVFCHQRYAFDFLVDQILPITRQELETQRNKMDALASTPKSQKSRQPARTYRKNEFPSRKGFRDTAIARQADIDLLAKSRHPNGIPNGMRDTYLFHTTCNLAWIFESQELEIKLKQWRDEFVPSVGDVELLRSMGTALRRADSAHNSTSTGKSKGLFDDARYLFSSSKLWDVFGGEIAEGKLQAQMKAILPTAERLELAKARKKAVRQAKQQTTYSGQGIRTCNIPLARMASDLHASGKSLREIGRTLGKSPKTVKVWLGLPELVLGIEKDELPTGNNSSIAQTSELEPTDFQLSSQQDPVVQVLPECSLNNGEALHAFGNFVLDRKCLTLSHIAEHRILQDKFSNQGYTQCANQRKTLHQHIHPLLGNGSSK